MSSASSGGGASPAVSKATSRLDGRSSYAMLELVEGIETDSLDREILRAAPLVVSTWHLDHNYDAVIDLQPLEVCVWHGGWRGGPCFPGASPGRHARFVYTDTPTRFGDYLIGGPWPPSALDVTRAVRFLFGSADCNRAQLEASWTQGYVLPSRPAWPNNDAAARFGAVHRHSARSRPAVGGMWAPARRPCRQGHVGLGGRPRAPPRHR